MSRLVFVLADKQSLAKGDCYSPFADYELKNSIYGCDWVAELENQREIFEALQDANRHYGDRVFCPLSSMLNGEEKFLGIVGFRHLIDKLKSQKEKRIERVREELERENPDLWRVAQVAYMESQFYFVYAPEAILINEIDMLDFPYPLEEFLYVTQVYRYSF